MRSNIQFSGYGKRVHRRHPPALYFYNWALLEVGGRWVCTKELKAWRGGKVEHMTKREAKAECERRNAASKPVTWETVEAEAKDAVDYARRVEQRVTSWLKRRG